MRDFDPNVCEELFPRQRRYHPERRFGALGNDRRFDLSLVIDCGPTLRIRQVAGGCHHGSHRLRRAVVINGRPSVALAAGGAFYALKDPVLLTGITDLIKGEAAPTGLH